MADTRKVCELLRSIDLKEYILPEFQRGYVWTQKQVKEYLDSLYRNYPTGSFLIWKTPQSQKTRGTVGNSENKFYKLILDGQQRLTSLYALFNGFPPPFYEGEKLFFNIYFNLDTEEFTYYMEKKMKGNIEWIPVTEFLKYGDVGKFIASTTDSARSYYSENLTKLIKLNEIRNYSYYITEISELDINEVVTVFNLVNSSGTPLSRADLALAHICSYWPEARDIFKDAQNRFSGHYFDFGLDFLTVCISAVSVDSVLFERSFYSAPIELIIKSWEKVESILEYIINVLRNDTFIDSSSNLKTPFVLIPIIYYLSKNEGRFKSDDEKMKFIYWMFNALMWGRYSGRTYQSLQQDIVNIKNTNKVEGLIEVLRRMRGGKLEVEADDLILEGTASRFFPMCYIVARSKGAIDWFNGISLYGKNLGTRYKIHTHHIFPQSLLYKHGFSSADRLDVRKVNELANLSFITQDTNLKISNNDPHSYLKNILKKYPTALNKQFMPLEEYWTIRRYEEFLSKRRDIISKEINKFLSNLIKGEKVFVPLTTEQIVAGGENEMVEFKSSLRWDYRQNNTNKMVEYQCLKTVAAFLNFNGGTLFIGVDDSEKIIGLDKDFKSLGKPDKDGFELHLNNIFIDSFGKEFRKYIHVTFENTKSGEICLVRVDPSKTPVFFKINGTKEFYIRTGNSSNSLDVEETTKYIKGHWELYG